MASHQPSKSSGRRRFLDSLQSGFDKMKDALDPKRSPSPAPAANLEPTALQDVKTDENIAWGVLDTALRVLEKSAEVFPPLQSAIGGLVACLDVVQTAATNLEDYDMLASELTTMARAVNQYVNELGSEDINGSIAHLAASIEVEVTQIHNRRDHGKARRTLESRRDEEDVIRRYRRIETLFQQLQNDVNIRTWRNTNNQSTRALLRGLSPVDDARYDSSYSTTVKRRGCTAKTREEIQSDLQRWVRDLKGPKVYWMNGMAGTGKTTIAYSLCKWLEDCKQLGASFFCSRASSSCRDVNRVVPTIAYHLARYSPAFRSALGKILEDDPDAGTLNVVRQFEKLVRDPMQEAKDSMPPGVIVVIDALDECEDGYGVQLILGTLLQLGTDLPVKFFMTSRPESSIRDKMLSSNGRSPSVLHLHDVEQSVVEEDIQKYLIEALELMSPPPSLDQIKRLANHAGKLFIYAATVARYILPGNAYVDSAERLKIMLALDSDSTSTVGSKRYKELDALYTTILAAALNEDILEDVELDVRKLVLRTVICVQEPMTAVGLASLLGLTERQVSSGLEPLRSVLHVCDAGGLVSPLHASFPDFMLNRSRSGNFHCDEAQHSEFLAGRCFKVMKEQLRFNICKLESSLVFDEDVPGLEQRINSCISPALFYSCRYWGDHLQPVGASGALRDEIFEFLTYRLLFWMEVLNLRLRIVEGIRVLLQVERWLLSTNISNDIQKLVIDARDFVTRFAGGSCIRSTPHIYISALPFCPRSSLIFTHYWGRTRGLMDVRGTVMRQRNKAAQATWVTDMFTHAVSFSPDGTLIAFHSYDLTFHLRDAYTGATVTGPFEGHTGSINSVAFSPDGARIASGSTDRTIRVWDARTSNTIAEPFEGHTDEVHSVAFSPDGTHIVSGSADQTIRLWNTYTGDIVAEPFEGHTGSINSVAFSPDGARVVSGSSDHTIRLWDARTGGTVFEPLKGHTDDVALVIFSPNGTHIISGSRDHTILVWDAYTGDIVSEPFKGDRGSVQSVGFSTYGARIVSGCADSSIQIWDAYTGEAITGPFRGHTNRVSSVAFSPDGTRIVSTSTDCTTRVWDALTSDVITGDSNAPMGRFRCVAFSLDGTRIASSSDCTIRVWDGRTGDTVAEPFKGHTDCVRAVAFSPDCTRIVSGSWSAILVWNTHTGDIVAGPFVVHDPVHYIEFSADSTRVVSGHHGRSIRVLNAYTGNPITGPFEGRRGEIWSIALSPDGTRIVSGSLYGTIRLWDAHTGHPIVEPFKAHETLVRSVAFSPDGTRIASGSDDQTIRVWDARTSDPIAGPFEGHTDEVCSVAFSPDSSRIISMSRDCTMRLWDAYTGDIIAVPFKGPEYAYSATFSSDGRVLSYSGDTIRVWDSHLGDANPPLPRADRLSNDDGNTHLVSRSNLAQDDYICRALMGIGDSMINDDGWVTTDGVPLFWVSPDLHQYVPHPHNTLVIGLQGTISIDYHNLLLGERWSECYTLQ